MSTVELVVLLIPVAAAMHLLAMRLKVPAPTLLVLGGLALAFMPGLPRIELSPNVVFLTFIPPLLYYGAITAPWRQFRLRAWPIVSLSVFLVLLTMAVVAVVAHALTPAFTWAAAFALGAIVSPPDPIAAVAVIRSLDVSRGIEGLLQGEGLANDATALVAYNVAVAAAVTGTFSPGGAAVRLVFAVVAGVGIGWVIGYVLCWLFRTLVRTPLLQNALILIVPYVSYVAADSVGASGVLAVVTVGLVLSRRGGRAFSAEVRLQFESLWTLLSFVLESMIFIFIGLELPVVVRGLHNHALWTLVAAAVVISGVCILVRLLWVFPSATVTRRSDLLVPGRAPTVWRQVAFVGWAGMRGADSLVIALALPTMTRFGTPFPARGAIIVITFGVILATLVVQGSTLGWLARVLRLTGASAREDVVQEGTAWIAAADAGLTAIEELDQAPWGESPTVRRRLARMAEAYRRRRRQWRQRIETGTAAPDYRLDPERRVELTLTDREREAVLSLRDAGRIDDAIARHVERYLDLETLLFNYAALDVDDSPFDSVG
jgi:monovalent cation/hydrogen antiporter